MAHAKFEEVGRCVAEAAYTVFCDCDAKEDFRVQFIGMYTVVFGGTNRLIFHPRSGFHPDRGYCTERFLKLFDEKYGG